MVHIRPFAPGDKSGVAAVIVPIQQGEFGVPVTLEDQPDLGDIPGFYQRGSGNFWVAEDAGEIVGTIGLLDIGGGRAALRKMFVVQPFRGKEHGVARRLLDELVAWALSKAISEIYLGTTDRFLAAHRFYEKNGFDEITRSELPEAFPVMAVDSRFYRRILSRES
jgi:N-acetylglutamate synthase-like GNAT family acetyltransferase